MNINELTYLFCLVDDFCKVYEGWRAHGLIPCQGKRRRAIGMSYSEMLTIVIAFHLGPCKQFKYHYLYWIGSHFAHCFPNLLSYSRFVQLMPRLFLPMSLLLHLLSGQKRGIYYADSTRLEVCHLKRTTSHKVFAGLAAMGKSSYGWFLGFKLHLIINEQGQIVAVKLTAGNVDDRGVVQGMSQGLKGSIYADKGYVSASLFQQLYKQGLKLITQIRKNMKNKLRSLIDKVRLRKRSLIESVFHILKNQMNLAHTRHRSVSNFCINLLGCLLAYTIKKGKKHHLEAAVLALQNSWPLIQN